MISSTMLAMSVASFIVLASGSNPAKSNTGMNQEPLSLVFVLTENLIRFMQLPASIHGLMESSLRAFVRLQIFLVRSFIRKDSLRTGCAMEPFLHGNTPMMQ